MDPGLEHALPPPAWSDPRLLGKPAGQVLGDPVRRRPRLPCRPHSRRRCTAAAAAAPASSGFCLWFRPASLLRMGAEHMGDELCYACTTVAILAAAASGDTRSTPPGP